ncbi:potassium-transporting ATPase subunit KdpC [Commensalibacter oyaizuii]|uniref:Potassium-transporting ATPase KdpC subunit n=1 Tax=Commensalibacter oyaizuii TaxID=3043873 RepID=A0ABT6PZ25_9PROT|nr:potassium-transporting ATPase subunit KdpC [Commensalibacter sp. TBRC 16381]MDI2090098.1 potassium-transporting ATPase subunit KdpC [Commensalibacter sp. TBRC 16381]
MKSLFRPALGLFIILSVITGVLYPLMVTGIAQTIFPNQANGSFIEYKGQKVGSALIGQSFTKLGYFWERPSATSERGYNAMASSGASIAPSNPELLKSAQHYAMILRNADPDHNAYIPIDLVTHSSSGLDPDISIAAALYQVPRIAKARGLTKDAVKAVIDQHSRHRVLTIFGEPVVNVLQLNLALDTLMLAKDNN